MKTLKPRPGDYFESYTEGERISTVDPNLTWKEVYERDLRIWEGRKYNKKNKIINILYSYSNPQGYRLLGEDNFEKVAEEIIKLWK